MTLDVSEPVALPASGAAPLPSAHALSAETRRLYTRDWADFESWCLRRRLVALPAAPDTLAAYLTSLATLSPGALGRRAAAVADRHRRASCASPAADAAVRAVLRAARSAGAARATGAARAAGADRKEQDRTKAGRTVRRKLSAHQLVRMAGRCSGDLAGLRDRALLLLAAAGLPAEALLALDREHVRFTAQGAELAAAGARGGGSAARAAGGESGSGTEGAAGAAAGPAVRVLSRAGAAAVCPVRALERWIDASDTRFGPVFRKVDRWGGVEHRRLRPDGLRRILRRRAKRPDTGDQA
jgi:hypothetical protein